MENLADRPFRRALAETVGGFDEACTEFIRVPGRTDNPHGSIRGVAAWYDARELGAVPLGAQIMGSEPGLMALAAEYLVQVKGAPRVDLNCGCPANTVTGHGAGSSLLRTPERLRDIVAAMVAAVGGAAPVSLKLRAGFGDTSRFEENLLAAQEGGASFVTLHPRTKAQAYTGAADWGLIARAVELLDIPVIGNGDVVGVERAQSLLRQTRCAGLMIGRGAVQDPLIFHRIRHSFEHPDAAAGAPSSFFPTCSSHAVGSGGGGGGGNSSTWPWNEPEAVQAFLRSYAAYFIPELREGSAGLGIPGTASAAATTTTTAAASPTSSSSSAPGVTAARGATAPRGGNQLGRLKKVMRYLFSSSPPLAEAAERLLRVTPEQASPAELLEALCGQVAAHWPAGGPARRVLIDHMRKESRELQPAAAAAVPEAAAEAAAAGPERKDTRELPAAAEAVAAEDMDVATAAAAASMTAEAGVMVEGGVAAPAARAAVACTCA